MIIRKATKSDINKAAIVYAEAFSHAGLGEKWGESSAKKFLYFFFNKQPDLFFVALEDKKIVGGVTGLIVPYWNGNHVMDPELFVRKDSRKKGIGKKLLRKFFKIALKRYKIVKIEMLVDKYNKFPMSWYKKLGFHETKLSHIIGSPEEILRKL